MMLVIVRTADAHAHFCFDGQEPPTSVHLGDGGLHPCESKSNSGHSGDKDVQLASDVVLKKAAADDVWLPPAVSFEIAFIPQSYSAPVLQDSQIVGLRNVLFFVPPLRGPPA